MLYWAYKNRRVLIVALACLIVVFLIGHYIWGKYADTEAKLQRATVLTEQQATDINYLQNALGESKQNAEMLAAKVKEAQAGSLQPVTRFTVEAPTVQVAAKQVAQRINDNDQSLPPAALSPCDRTLTVPQQVKQPDGTAQWQVGVYKVNNFRNWEWGAGVGIHKGDTYIPVSLQRNYSKDRAIEAEAHVNTAGGGIAGGEIKYKVKTDKLFFLF